MFYSLEDRIAEICSLLTVGPYILPEDCVRDNDTAGLRSVGRVRLILVAIIQVMLLIISVHEVLRSSYMDPFFFFYLVHLPL